MTEPTLTDSEIIAIRDEHLPSQGEPFDCIAFAQAILAARTLRAMEDSQEGRDPEWDQIPPFIPTRRCPKCWTYGHTHRKDCPFAGTGMEHHIAMQAQEQSKGGDANGPAVSDRADVTAGDAHPHKHAQAADPPSPPEDALLAAKPEMIYARERNPYAGPVVIMQPEDYKRLRERIAADAKRIAGYQQAVMSTDRERELEVRAQRAEALHHELLYAVAQKCPGETRHETALRYIRQREAGSACGGVAAALAQQPERK